MKKKFLALFISVLLICTIFSGCGDSADIDGDSKTDLSVNTSKDNPTDDSKDDSTDTWTVMLYLCGTDLESGGGAATSNLNEIFASDLSENVNFLIQTGGTQTWHTDGIDSSKLQRFKVENSQLSLIDQQESASMGAADTLGSFLNWGATKYPADKYMVVFWNHGGGSVSGVEFDELYENDSLSLIELADGLSQAKVPFEVIGFDTCLMATLENAVQIAPYGKYMVASEEYEPGGGWQYTSWLNFLSENIASTGKELGTAICDSYYQKCESAENEAMATLSVVDLSKIEALNAAFEKMASEMIGLTTDVTSFQRFAKGASKAENYGGNTNEEG
ncbi:MAG: clostripain-related cysteine peptidase, partial [Clostridia bacterium]